MMRYIFQFNDRMVVLHKRHIDREHARKIIYLIVHRFCFSLLVHCSSHNKKYIRKVDNGRRHDTELYISSMLLRSTRFEHFRSHSVSLAHEHLGFGSEKESHCQHEHWTWFAYEFKIGQRNYALSWLPGDLNVKKNGDYFSHTRSLCVTAWKLMHFEIFIQQNRSLNTIHLRTKRNETNVSQTVYSLYI